MKQTSAGFALGMLMLAVLFILVGCQDDQQPLQSGETPNMEQTTLEKAGYQGARLEAVPNELLVKFASGASNAQRGAALGAVNGSVAEKILTKAMQNAGDNEGLTLVRTPMSENAAVNALRGLAGVEYAEPNYYYYHDATSNDPYYANGSLWGMYGDGTTPVNQFGSQAGEAWANNTGSSNVIVGIIDEGFMYAHEDLSANAWVNPYDAADGVGPVAVVRAGVGR